MMSISSPTFEPTSPAEPDAEGPGCVADHRWRSLEKVSTPKLVPVTPTASSVRAGIFGAGFGDAEVHTPLPPSPSRRHYMYSRRNARRVPRLSSSAIGDEDCCCASDMGAASGSRGERDSGEQSACGSADSGMHTPKNKSRSKLPDEPFLFSPSAPKRRTRRICLLSSRSPEPVYEAEADVTSSTGESTNGGEACQPTVAPSTYVSADCCASPLRSEVRGRSQNNASVPDVGLSPDDEMSSCAIAEAGATLSVASREASQGVGSRSSPNPLTNVGDEAGSGSGSSRSVVLSIPVPDGFDFSMAICSYGFFCMMPNEWIPSSGGAQGHGTFRRPLRYGKQAERCCDVTITCSEETSLSVCVDGDLPSGVAEEAEIVQQIKRMCRLDSSAFRGHTIESFWRLHPQAKARRFGYLFRSPTVWEDMVKTITICNARWKQSCTMNRLLCTEVSSRKGSFPSPWDVCRYTSEELQKACSLGYRAERVRRLAESIVSGTLDIASFDALYTASLQETGSKVEDKKKVEEKDLQIQSRVKRQRTVSTSSAASSHAAILQKLRSVYGFGTFASENMMQLLGFFNVDAFDSETVRHMREKHGVKLEKPQQVWDAARKRFACYSPFQFLAYWFELWEGYEAKSGCDSPHWTAQNSFFVSN